MVKKFKTTHAVILEQMPEVFSDVAPTLRKTLAFYSQFCDKQKEMNLSGYDSPEEPDSF